MPICLLIPHVEIIIIIKHITKNLQTASLSRIRKASSLTSSLALLLLMIRCFQLPLISQCLMNNNNKIQSQSKSIACCVRLPSVLPPPPPPSTDPKPNSVRSESSKVFEDEFVSFLAGHIRPSILLAFLSRPDHSQIHKITYIPVLSLSRNLNRQQ